MVNPNHITPYSEISEQERELADDLVFNRREDALERFIAHFESKGEEDAGAGRRRPDRGDGARGGAALPHPAPPQGRRRGADRPQRGEDRRGADAQRGAAAGDEGGRRQVRRRRTDPAVRAAVGRGDEARGRAAGEIPRQDRGLHEGHGRAGDGVRRRARHRQVAGQHDPHEQRLHRRRPRQAGADPDDRRRRPGARRDRDRPVGAAGVDLQADARLHPGAARQGPALPRADRRRGDQPRVQLPRAVPGRQGLRGGLRAGRVLLQGRLRGTVGDGPADRRRRPRRARREAARGRDGVPRQGRGARRRS